MFDAWDIDSNYREQELEGAFDVCTELVADGIEAVIKVTGKIGNSSYTQYIRLAKDSRRLEFDTTIDLERATSPAKDFISSSGLCRKWNQ